MEKLTLTQLQDRADNKVASKIFFAQNKLAEYKMMSNGIIDHGIAQETIDKMISSAEIELDVWHYINHKLTFND